MQILRWANSPSIATGPGLWGSCKYDESGAMGCLVHTCDGLGAHKLLSVASWRKETCKLTCPGDGGNCPPPVRLQQALQRFRALIECSCDLAATLMLQASTIIEAGQVIRVAVSQAAGLRLSMTANAPREIAALIPGIPCGSHAKCRWLRLSGD